MSEKLEGIRLRVKPAVLLPHQINVKIDGVPKTLVFKPNCATPIPAARAEALLKSYPDVFELDNGPFDPKGYQMRKTFKRDMVVEALNQLTDEELLVAFDFVNSVVANRGKGLAGGAGAGSLDKTPTLEEMKRSDLLEMAAAKGINLPANAPKAEIIQAIREAGSDGGADGGGS